MIPVIQKDMSKIHVVVCSRRSIDDDSTKHPIPCLDVKVRVVPSSAVFHSAPPISVGVSRGNRALRNTWHAIHEIGPILADSVKVKTSAVTLQGIRDMNH